ncbi:hypothetical protein SAMN05660862_3622 [Sphingobacterium psychroaquaticum]|uniref:Uncharacterized protein n=1 Tax=Sphingobacterium psychroaquaticum TaxID=561061 RepID=A0A1X7L631_9SPHI|nr:hypothetical protein SAMN05660862_3622 [Sphingobacterium psychroaquaticum]
MVIESAKNKTYVNGSRFASYCIHVRKNKLFRTEISNNFHENHGN